MRPLDSTTVLAVIAEETCRSTETRWVSSPGKLIKLILLLCYEIGWKLTELKCLSNFLFDAMHLWEMSL